MSNNSVENIVSTVTNNTFFLENCNNFRIDEYFNYFALIMLFVSST